MKASLALLIGCLMVSGECMKILWKDCDNELKASGEIISISIEPCESLPCVLVKGQNAKVIVVFKPKNDVKRLNTIVHGKIGPIWIPFPLDNPDGCKNTGLACPLKANQEYTYTFSLPVSKLYPSLSLVVRWELQDLEEKEEYKNPVCFTFPTSLRQMYSYTDTIYL